MKTLTLMHSRKNTSQRGQAMTEFVIGALLVLIPLFLIIPVLGKYADIKATNAVSARYVTWERTVWYGGDASSPPTHKWPGAYKTDEAIRNETNRRVVSNEHGIEADDGTKSEFANDGAKGSWRSRDGGTMLANYSDATSGIENKDAPDVATRVIVKPVTDVVGFLGFSLEGKGLYVGTTSLKVGTMPIGLNLDGSTGGRFDPGLLTFTDKNAVLANTWSANGSPHVKSMVSGLTPLGFMNNPTLKAAFTAMKVALVLFTPEIVFLEPGKVEPDVVPPDRLTD